MNKQLKILLLEDIKHDYDLITQELKNLDLNYTTKLVSDEKSFQDAIKTYKPDIILSDYSLAQYDGMSALLYTLKVAPQTPFIIVTGSINEEIAIACIKAGATDYVTKEHLSRLIFAIKGALQQIKSVKDQAHTKDKLIESEERYRRLFEDSIDPILIIEDYKFVDCNDATVRFLNYESKSQFLNKPPSDLSPEFQPDGKPSKDKALEMMDLALKNGNHNFEWIHLTKDKKEIWVDVALTHIPMLGKNGLYTIWRNISDRKNAEITKEVLFNISESLEASDSLGVISGKIHQELGKIIDNTNFYIALYNAENDTYSFPFYKDKFDIVDPEEESNLTNSITDYVRKEGKPLRITKAIEEELNKTKKIKSIGKPSPVWIGAPLIDTSSDKIIGIVAVQNYENENALTDKDVDLLAFVARNIGTAIARKKAELAISESEELFRSLAQTATDAIIIINNEGDIIFWNNAATTIFQYGPSEIIGKNLHNTIIPGEYYDKAYKGLKKFFNTGKGDVLGRTIELNGKRKDGSLFPIELSVSKFLKNEKWHATGFIRDITQRKKDEEELKKAKEKAEESDRLKTAFLANMSHEIRTPMNAILGFSELLSMSDLSNEERNEFINLINSNSNNLLNLIDDIIDIAKIEAGQLKMSYKDFDLLEILKEIDATYQEINYRQNKEKVSLVWDQKQSPEVSFINSDPHRLKQVLSNLIGNAIKYTEQGIVNFGYKILDDVNLEKTQKKIQFYVKDTGLGISTDKINIIFDRFRQADDSHTRIFGGTGLGLAISKNIAKLLGGDIHAVSTVGKGSVFYFTLPFIECREPELGFDQTEIDLKNINWSKKTILIAEDVESNFQLLKTYLQKTNAKIIWAKNGQEALDECKKNDSIDLILMDMQMPGLNGYEATQLIKSIRPDLPIIAETAFALAGDREKILEAGCDDYVSKPIKANELYEKLKKYLY